MEGAFALKRLVWDRLRELGEHDVSAPIMRRCITAAVYVLPPAAQARCPIYVKTYWSAGQIPMPSRAMIIETLCSTDGGSVVDFVYSEDDGRTICVHPHIWKRREMGYEESRAVKADLVTHEITGLWKSARGSDEAEAMVNTVLDCICAIMHRGTRTITKRVPVTKRRGGLPGGHLGWEYRVVEIPEGFSDVTRIDRGGTHVSPRWHMRRGHLRHLQGGSLVVPVRECEVGDRERGGVIKDYDLRPDPVREIGPRRGK